MLLRAFEDALMPLRCVFCGERSAATERHICMGCRADLPWRDTFATPAPPDVDTQMVPLAYAFPVDAALKAYKFRRRLFYGPAFAQLLIEAGDGLPADIDAVLPVPLHWRRRWWRGFNQAYEIAKPVARHLGVPLVRGVRRSRATPFQSGLSAHDRARNLRSAFRIRGQLTFEHVLIVDDVITTGTTTSELARALRRAGVDRASVAAVARA